MKKNFFLLMGIAAMLTACEKTILTDEDMTTYDGTERTRITFTVNGDFHSDAATRSGSNAEANSTLFTLHSSLTRASLSADGKDMTDLWLLDYQDGALKQQLHQQTGDPDFGTPSLSLPQGSHTLYFVASRGKQPVLSTAEHTITWGTPSDTFWQAVTLTVDENTAATQTVTLHRVTTKLSITIQDALPTDIATISLEPTNWFYALDYTNGSPTGAQQQAVPISVPSSCAGQKNQSVSFFGLSSADEWQADITVTATDGDDNILGQTVIRNAPFKANRVTAYKGNLFNIDSGFTLALDGAWDEEYSGEW